MILPDTSPIALPTVSVQHKTFSISVPGIMLERGEILGIFGKSGSGKTTYMKRVRESFSPERVLYMSQFDCLLEEITIRQNIELGLACADKPASAFADWETDYKEILSEFEVDKHLHKLPRQMSGGQRKRAEIVRSLIMDPEILLLDEPFQGIGHLFESVSTKHLLSRADRKHGITVIVSHDFDLLCRFSNRILLMDDKGVIEMAPTRDKNWKPMNLRAAWTLGVENLIPAAQVMRIATGNALTSMTGNQMLAFWSRQGNWNRSNGVKLTIKRGDIGSQRSFQRHGEANTQIETISQGSEKPLLLIAAGTPEGNGDVTLGIEEHWVVEDNEKRE